MKIAKATQADMDAAVKIMQALDAISGGNMPGELIDDQDADDDGWFDNNNYDHCHRVINHLIGLTEEGNFLRVVGGMAVLLDPDNKVIDPDAKTLEHHPDRLEADSVRQQRDELLAKCAEWERCAANWMASPEAAQKQAGYRELAQRLNLAEQQRDDYKHRLFSTCPSSGGWVSVTEAFPEKSADVLVTILIDGIDEAWHAGFWNGVSWFVLDTEHDEPIEVTAWCNFVVTHWTRVVTAGGRDY